MLLRVEDLQVKFPVKKGWWWSKPLYVHAVDGVSFSISEGKTLGLVGESGCGKSTTGRALLQLQKTTGGKIHFLGKEIESLEGDILKKFRQQVQMVFQNPFSSLDPRMTVESILLEPLKALTNLSGKQLTSRVDELLRIVQMEPSFKKRFPHEFSGGQRQRINIARALAVGPKLLVADEPVSALDVSIQAQIINLMQDLQDQLKVSYLFISHDLSVVRTLCHEVAVMYLGRIVEQGPTNEVFNHPKHPYTKALLASAPLLDPFKAKKKERAVVKGETPSPIHRPSGCRFHPRCPIATDLCKKEDPLLKMVDGSRSVACHYSAS